MGSRGLVVYILASANKVLYVGVTSDLARRLEEHRTGKGGAFTSQYRTQRLVHVESFNSAIDAIRREKQLKGWTRKRKIALIESMNAAWADLSPFVHSHPTNPMSS